MTAHVSRSIGSGSPWSSPEDALLADGVAASARVFMSSSSSLLLVSDFRLGVPAAATLRGVVVAVVRKGGEVIDASLQLSVDGAPSGEDRRGLAAHHDDGHVLRVTNARHDASPSEPAGGGKVLDSTSSRLPSPGLWGLRAERLRAPPRRRVRERAGRDMSPILFGREEGVQVTARCSERLRRMTRFTPLAG